jgi:hypothetical protein
VPKRRKEMNNNNLIKLIGNNNKSIQTNEVVILGNHSLKKIIQYFKRIGFGVLTLQGIESPKSKIQKIEVKKLEIELQRRGLNYVKFQGRWLINFKEPISTPEISFFIIIPKLETMSLLARQFDQGTFIYSENGDNNLYYMDGFKIALEKDKYKYGDIIDEAYLLKCKDFKFIYDKTLDFNFQFISNSEVAIGDFVLIEHISTNVSSENLEIVKIDDIRQNAVINFIRENEYHTIKPLVCQFDEIKYMIKLNSIGELKKDFIFDKAM